MEQEEATVMEAEEVAEEQVVFAIDESIAGGKLKTSKYYIICLDRLIEISWLHCSFSTI